MDTQKFSWKNFDELTQNIENLIIDWKAHNYEPKTWFFRGDLGAGKSTMIRRMIQALSNTKKIPSPTYSLMEPYETDAGTIAHFDLYRLDSDQDFMRYGLTEYAEDPDTICFIEWPERISPALQNLFGSERADIQLSINKDHTQRTATITFNS